MEPGEASWDGAEGLSAVSSALAAPRSSRRLLLCLHRRLRTAHREESGSSARKGVWRGAAGREEVAATIRWCQPLGVGLLLLPLKPPVFPLSSTMEER